MECVLAPVMCASWNLACSLAAKCTEKKSQVTRTRQEKELVDKLVQFHCPDGTYNEVASLFFTDSDTAIKQLFHFREVGNFDEDIPTFTSLAIATHPRRYVGGCYGHHVYQVLCAIHYPRLHNVRHRCAVRPICAIAALGSCFGEAGGPLAPSS